jgi:predicted lactoylglutathione lyase
MIGYVTLGTNNLNASSDFYDRLFASIDIGRNMEMENVFVSWGAEDTNAASASLAVTMPFDGEAATVGNGVMVALNLGDPERVKAFYEKAIALGATDEGKPGFRPEGASSGFYCGYFRDLDGNKLNAFCLVVE